jgi:hypothetical protein
MKQQSHVNSGDIHPNAGKDNLGRETTEETKSERDKFLVFRERQKENEKIQVN